MEKIILVQPDMDVMPGFMRVDTTYSKIDDLMPLPFEGKTELTYQEQFPVTTPELHFERKEPVWLYPQYFWRKGIITGFNFSQASFTNWRSEEHTSELQSLMRISYAVFCLKKKTNIIKPK